MCTRRLVILSVLVAFIPVHAVADIAPEPDEGTEFVTVSVGIENMADFPEFSILVYDSAPTITAHRVFNTGSETQQLLTRGDNWRSRGDFSTPRLWLMTRTDQEAWSEATREEVSRQREACSERGEGCAHISRFSPTYSPPEGAIDCGVQISIVSSRPIDLSHSPDLLTVYRVTEASDQVCTVELASSDQTAPSIPPVGGGKRWPLIASAFLLLLVAGLVVRELKRTASGGRRKPATPQISNSLT